MMPRGVKQAISLAAFVSPFLGSYLAYPLPVYGPLVGFAIGCCAISISVQQMFAYSTRQSQQAEHTVYFWSALTLAFLGAGTVAGCLPNMVQLGLTSGTQRVFFAVSTSLFVIGFITLFRLAAAYLYRGKRDILSDHRYRIFRRKATADHANAIEASHLVVMLFCLAVAALSYFIEDAIALPAKIVADAPVYFPLWQGIKVVLAFGLIFTSGCILWFFLSKFKRIKGGELIDGVEFVSVMGVLFLAPCVIQATALFPWANGFEKWIIICWLVFLGIIFLFVIFNWVDELEPTTAGSQNISSSNIGRVKVAILISLGISFLFCVMLLYNDALLRIIPFIFITLGFLTLACAYLPIHDLEKLSVSAKPEPGAATLQN